MSEQREARVGSEGSLPLLDIEGEAYDCGLQLGQIWAENLRLRAREADPRARAAWCDSRIALLFERYAPYLPDLFRGMSKGAGVEEKRLHPMIAPREDAGCTSFALAPSVTLDGHPISGQTKDTPGQRIMQYQVLRLRVRGGASMLTATYAGEIFGHGFVAGGCALFRNSLNGGDPTGRVPYFTLGLLLLHCTHVDQARELLAAALPNQGFHCPLADEHGGILGIEMGAGGAAFLEPVDGIYVHANHVVSGPPLADHVQDPSESYSKSSALRQARLTELFARERGRLTAQRCYLALCDREGYPIGICSDRRPDGNLTTAAIVAEPTRGLLHVTRGVPSQNWPQTFRL